MNDAERHRDGIVVSGITTPIKQAVIQAVLETVGLPQMTGEDFQFLAHIDNWGHALLDRYRQDLNSRPGFGRSPPPEPVMDWGQRPTGPAPAVQPVPVEPAWPASRETSPGLTVLPEDNAPAVGGFAEDQQPGELLSPATGDENVGTSPEREALASTWKPGPSDLLDPPEGQEGETLLPPGDAPNYEDLAHGIRPDYAQAAQGNLKG